MIVWKNLKSREEENVTINFSQLIRFIIIVLIKFSSLNDSDKLIYFKSLNDSELNTSENNLSVYFLS